MYIDMCVCVDGQSGRWGFTRDYVCVSIDIYVCVGMYIAIYMLMYVCAIDCH